MSTGQAPPLVSVVTPFYNTDCYLEECIRSVLAQSYQNIEYVLVNNCSTDSSREIAAAYCSKDPRIRLCDTPSFLTQVQNYNYALSLASATSRYTKIVQADDWIYPDCVRRLVAVAESNDGIAVVGCYYSTGRSLHGAGLNICEEDFAGKDVCKATFERGIFPFGTPTTLLFRSDVIRSRTPFYSESSLHEDTEACYEILRDYRFGFCHQVLAFTRVDQYSIYGSVQDLDPLQLDRLIILRKYGRDFLTPEEYAAASEQIEGQYYSKRARSALLFREQRYWDYHRRGLDSIGARRELGPLFRHGARQVVDLVLNPKSAVSDFLRFRRRRRANVLS